MLLNKYPPTTALLPLPAKIIQPKMSIVSKLGNAASAQPFTAQINTLSLRSQAWCPRPQKSAICAKLQRDRMVDSFSGSSTVNSDTAEVTTVLNTY